MVELTAALAVLGIVAASSAPDLLAWRARHRLRGASQGLALTLSGLRAAAAATGQARALDFSRELGGLSWRIVMDGDGDGVRSRDLRRGTDPVVGGPYRLDAVYPGVRSGRPAGVPTLLRGAPGSGGVAFGRASRCVFKADGRSSTGTLYLRSGNRYGAAVRVYGATGRVSVWWWVVDDGRWAPLR